MKPMVGLENDRSVPGLVLSPEQKRRQRARNLAIGLTVAFLCVLFYAVTIVKLGPGILNRAL